MSRVMRTARQHGLTSQQRSLLARRQHLLDDVERLRLIVLHGDVPRLADRGPIGAQLLLILPRAVAHQRIRRIEDRLHRAIVLLELDDAAPAA